MHLSLIIFRGLDKQLTTFRAAFKLGRHVFLRFGAKTQNRQYGQSLWVLCSNELTQGKETFNIY